MTKREEISKKIQDILNGTFLEEDYYYCPECSLLLIDEKTSGLIEERLGGYCDICMCDKID